MSLTIVGAMQSPHFRPMYRKDIPSLLKMSRDNMAQIILSSWGIVYRDEDTLEVLLKSNSQTEVIEVDGAVVGFFSLERQSDTIFVNALQVKKQFQRQRLGECMMKRIEKIALEEEDSNIDLWVQTSNQAAMNFYLALGYSTMRKQGNNFLMRKMLSHP